MKLEKNKVYTCRINGYDHSSTNDPFYKGEKWESVRESEIKSLIRGMIRVK